MPLALKLHEAKIGASEVLLMDPPRRGLADRELRQRLAGGEEPITSQNEC